MSSTRPILYLRLWGGLALSLSLCLDVRGEDARSDRLRGLNADVLPRDTEPGRMLGADLRGRLDTANRRSTAEWRKLANRQAWETFRDEKLKALRASLGDWPEPPTRTPIHVARTLEGDGFRIENLRYESRPGLWVTANLYRPLEKPKQPMPGIVICPSHHNPRTQTELQDMGVLWARLGCSVLVPDNLGHGERRSHPFVDAQSYPRPFRVGRQDYYFRYNVGLQLHLIGESLIGWMAWDMMRGIDVLLAHAGADPKRIVLLGSVAGGGDPAAVTAALDRRIAAAVPFNFGGPQPETRHPLPADAEEAFNYAGGGSWESTRNLRLSARDGFLPWVIVGAIAPRGLVYAHEFAWDRERDPVWKRLETIYGWYDATDRLAFTHGSGSVRGQAPESTHCNNIGAVHRRLIHPAFTRWLDLPKPDEENRSRRPATDLLVAGADAKPDERPAHFLTVARRLADERLAAARADRAKLPPAEARRQLAADWEQILGPVRLAQAPKATVVGQEMLDGVALERFILRVEREIDVPALLLRPLVKGKVERPPVVIAVAQEGKQRFLRERAAALNALLRAGVAVCLPDLRGTGETRPGDGRGRSSAATSYSATEQMLGGTLLGGRLRDLGAVLAHLGARADIDRNRMAFWGESFAAVNPGDRNLAVPLDADDFPAQAEPLGGLLATLAPLYFDQLRAVVARGGLLSQRSLLDEPFLYIPHDAIVPGALTVGDLADAWAVATGAALRFEELVDGMNRRVKGDAVERVMTPVRAARRAVKSAGEVSILEKRGADDELAQWLADRLR